MKISTFYSLLIGILVILLSACNSGSSNSTSSASSSFIINKVKTSKTESLCQGVLFIVPKGTIEQYEHEIVSLYYTTAN